MTDPDRPPVVHLEDIVAAVMSSSDLDSHVTMIVSDVHTHPSGQDYVSVDLTPFVSAVVEATMHALISMGIVDHRQEGP